MSLRLLAVAFVALLGCTAEPSTDGNAPTLMGEEVTSSTAPASSELATSKPALQARVAVAFLPPGALSISDVDSVKLTLTVLGAEPAPVALEFFHGRMSYERKITTLVGAPDEEQVVEFDLPVIGTMIETSSLHGRWDVTVFLNEQPMVAQTFELAP